MASLHQFPSLSGVTNTVDRSDDSSLPNLQRPRSGTLNFMRLEGSLKYIIMKVRGITYMSKDKKITITVE